jgi:DNA-binding transcriptional ArsR family regulator
MNDDGEPSDTHPRVTDTLELTEASAVIEALSSATSRAIFEAVYQEAGTASEIADRVDTSVQNASYHLEKLCEADLLEVGCRRQTEGNRPLDVYEPTDEPVLLLLGVDEQDSTAVAATKGTQSTLQG